MNRLHAVCAMTVEAPAFESPTGKAKAIRFSTLESICQVLNCQPADILEYVHEKK